MEITEYGSQMRFGIFNDVQLNQILKIAYDNDTSMECSKGIFFATMINFIFSFIDPRVCINNLSAINVYDLILVDHFSSLAGVKIPAPIFWTLLKKFTSLFYLGGRVLFCNLKVGISILGSSDKKAYELIHHISSSLFLLAPLSFFLVFKFVWSVKVTFNTCSRSVIKI